MWTSAHENVVQSFRRQVIDCISRSCCAASICGTAVLRVGRAAGCELDVLEVPMEHFGGGRSHAVSRDWSWFVVTD